VGIRAQSLYLQSEKKARELGWRVGEMRLTGFWSREWSVGRGEILPWAQPARGAKHESEVLFECFLAGFCRLFRQFVYVGNRDRWWEHFRFTCCRLKIMQGGFYFHPSDEEGLRD
jgi:hypothetical protein